MAVQVSKKMKSPKELNIIIVGYDNAVRSIFIQRGFKVSTVAALNNPKSYDGIVFTGGGDINPYLYGQGLHPSTTPDYARDLRELAVLRRVPITTPKIGICRGAQLLNVFNGGTLVQDLDNHRSSHKATDLWGGKEFTVSSLHHQMIVPHKDAWIMMTASVSTRHSTYEGTDRHAEGDKDFDIEACYYPHTETYCFQGHPEYAKESADVFFEHLESIYGTDAWAQKDAPAQQVSVG